MIRKSLTGKLIVVFSAILVAVIILSIVFNALMLKKVYQDKKIGAMESLYGSIVNTYEESDSHDKIIDILKNVLSKENLRVFIWDNTDRLIIDSLPLSFSKDNDDFIDNNNPLFDKFKEPRRISRYNRNELFLFHKDVPKEEQLIEKEDYLIFSHTSFDEYNEKTICLRSSMPNGYKLLIQMPYAPIDEALSLSNSLLLIIGAIMLLIGIVVVTITSKTIARPVKELSDIALSMKQLDFSKKYTVSRTDEIGSLGASINSLSEKLEETINELYEKNEKLEADIELKSRIDTMRKEFIANSSHELKTPLALISGYAEGLKDCIASDEETRKLYTEVIIEEAGKMDMIIRQMLELVELDSSSVVIKDEVFSLTKLIEDVIKAFDLIIKQRNIQLTLQIEEGCFVKGDYYRIYQAATNYFSNAINHVNFKNIIDVSLKKDGDKVVFSVYNSCAPISDDDLVNIWERFYKIDKSHTRAYGGSGLGLSIVKSAIELHNGICTVKNRDEGVEFCFILKNEEKIDYEI